MQNNMTDVRLYPLSDFSELGEIWSAFEQRISHSFFQSWAWTGCLAEERFPRPIILEARDGAELRALGLFNLNRELYRTSLWLGQSGNCTLDAPFIEYN